MDMQKKSYIKISGKKLLKLRERLSLTQAEMGDLLKVSDGRIRQIEKAEDQGIYPKGVRALAALLKVTPDQIPVVMGPEKEPPNGDFFRYSEVEAPEPPQFDLPIAAGTLTAIPPVEEHDPRQLQAAKHRRFRVKIRGESMEKEYADGCIVEFVCLHFEADGTVPGVETGKDYYVQVAEEATFKRLKSFTDEELVLVALNRKKFPKEIRLRRSDVNRMARAVAIIQPKG